MLGQKPHWGIKTGRPGKDGPLKLISYIIKLRKGLRYIACKVKYVHEQFSGA